MCTAESSPRYDDQEYALSSVEALLAGTLALMTGMMQASPDCANARPMANKIAANLDELARHPALSETMRTMLTRLLPHWVPLAEQGHHPCTSDATDRALWLHAPQVLQ
ncbi:hypothetical protein [Ottowia sp.]|uniref:hypothetical protein n=1 Tax=Ottowia sp. TaxID=1898956 RepID=UPI003A868CB5